MKKLFFTIIFFAICVVAKAQINKDTVGLNLSVKDGQVIYTGVVEMDGKTKKDLYRNAQQWLIDYFYSQKDIIQDKDKEDGLVVGRAVLYFFPGIGLGQNVDWADHVTIKIECKDNKYRYSFYNIVIYNNDSSHTNFDVEQLLGSILGTQKWPWTKRTLIRNDVLIKNAIISLKNAMGKTITDF